MEGMIVIQSLPSFTTHSHIYLSHYSIYKTHPLTCAMSSSMVEVDIRLSLLLDELLEFLRLSLPSSINPSSCPCNTSRFRAHHLSVEDFFVRRFGSSLPWEESLVVLVLVRRSGVSGVRVELREVRVSERLRGSGGVQLPAVESGVREPAVR